MRKLALIIFLILFIPVFFTMFISNPITNDSLITLLFATLMIIIMDLIIIFMIKVIKSVISVPIKRSNEVRRKEDAKYIDSKDYLYIREIPKQYTPALASLLLDQHIEYNKDITATVLYLINHGYLKIVDGKIIATNKNTDDLMEHERYLLGLFNKKEEFYNSVWYGKVLKDAYKLNLITKKDSFNKQDYIRLGINITKPIIGIIIFIILIINLPNSESVAINFIYTFILSLLPYLITAMLIYILFYVTSYLNKNIKLTTKGKEEQEKIAKLKQFLKDFSNIEERKTEDYILWEDYLTFSVALGLNEKVITNQSFKDKLNHVREIIQPSLSEEINNSGI